MKLNAWNDDSPYLIFHELLKKEKAYIKGIFTSWQMEFLGMKKNGVSAGLTQDIFQFINKHNDLR